MPFTIDGEPRHLIPIKDFRAAHGLPPEFGVTLFEPKDYTGLGRIDRAGAELNRVRATLLDSLPPRMSPAGWLAFLPDYARRFEEQLYAINAAVGLKDVEIEFAVAGFSDVLHQFTYALLTLPSGSLPASEEGEVRSQAVTTASSSLHEEPGDEVAGSAGAIRTPVPWQTPRELYDALKPFARQMRTEPTPAEAHLWEYIRDRQVLGYKFRRQHTIDRFIVDFYCSAANVVIEVDGAIHDYTPEEDALRQAYLESLGIRVVRFTNENILDDTENVVRQIGIVLQSGGAHSDSPPRLRGGVRGGVIDTNPTKDLFRRVYANWLDSSLRVFTQVYPYDHHGQPWSVQLIAHAYGRAGLLVRTPAETHYVYDPALGCPAEGFMAALLADIAARILATPP